MNYVEVAQAEIIDWWDTTRSLVVQKCAGTERKLISWMHEVTADFTTFELVSPWSEARTNLQTELEEKIREERAALAKTVELSLEDSLRQIENSATYREINLIGAGLFAASGATAAGAVGLAVAATGLATTTLPAFIFLSTTAFSWPIFATVGGAAVALGLVSYSARNKGYEWVLQEYRSGIQSMIEGALTAESQSGHPLSCRVELCQQIDAARDERLKRLDT